MPKILFEDSSLEPSINDVSLQGINDYIKMGTILTYTWNASRQDAAPHNAEIISST